MNAESKDGQAGGPLFRGRLDRQGVRAILYIVNNVAVSVHTNTTTSALSAIQVAGVHADKAVLRALGSIDASWPEHYYWAMRAFDRGDFWVDQKGQVWFFEGEDGEALAGL